MYVKAYPRRFQRRILAELLAYLDARGENPLWNVLGRHFTGLSYHAADHLSAENKEFILSLFPSEKIYTCLMPERVQAILEKPGPDSVPAKILLERIGFRYLYEVDPFDGGPLYGAGTDEISVIRRTRRFTFLSAFRHLPTRRGERGLVMTVIHGRVRACQASARISKGGLCVEQEAAKLVELKAGGEVWFCPL